MLERLRQKIFENLGIKITSLVLALAVYAHVYSQQDHTAVLQAPLVIEGLPPGMTYQGETPSSVKLRIRATGSDLFKLRAQPPKVVVNIQARFRSVRP